MEHKNFWARAMALGLSGALLLSGCGGGGETKATPTPEPTPTPVVESEGPTDYSKYNAYLTLVDSIYDIEDVLTVYFNNVDYAEEFTVVGDYGAIKDVAQNYTSFTYSVKNALEYADEAPSYPDADAAMKALGESPIAVMDALDHLASYLRWDDYLEDDLARGPELHAELWAALETYDAYYGTFLSAMETLADETRGEGMEELLADGQLILYYSTKMIYACQDILDDIWDQVEAAANEAGPEAEFELPALDNTTLSPLFAELQTAYEELNKALEDEEEREKVSTFTGVVGDSSVKLYSNQMNNCYSKMGTLAQALLDGADYADAYDNASEAVNGFIGAYNNIN